MCAINGYNFKDPELIHAMNKATAHRGPDGHGVFSDDGITLGHNRLSIIDLSPTAGQPMFNNKKNLAIVFNGEIYNFRELKSELASSYNFRTNSDTEVILAAYERWGNRCVRKLNGMFAFTIWNKEQKELFLARDHVGIKPLYYHHDANTFIFSSEIKGILEYRNVAHTLDLDAFNLYSRVLYVPEPLTMFKHIRKFPKASYGVLKNGKLHIEKYWDPKFGDYLRQSQEQIQTELKERIRDSVNHQLVSDRPVGVYLSGGIDSSVILHNVMDIKGEADTFSIGFDLDEGEERLKFNQDALLAKRTADFYGTRHHEVYISADEVMHSFEKAVFHLDEPNANPTVISQIILGNFAKKQVDVVLGGDGGDELFGGYERYRLGHIAKLYQKIPRHVRSILGRADSRLAKLGVTPGVEQYALFMFQKDSILKQVLGADFFKPQLAQRFFDDHYFSGNTNFTPEEILMDVDRKSWLVDDSLVRSDRAAMAWGLEERVPLLDKDLVEFALRIPLKYKLDFHDSKKILKQAYRGHIPEFLFGQQKRGWQAPAAKWIRRPEIFSKVSESLSPGYYKETESLFEWGEIQDILEGHRSKGKYNLTVLWMIMAFQVWAKRYGVRL